jgi:hypothetical protein
MTKVSTTTTTPPPLSRVALTTLAQVGDYVRLKEGHEREYNRYSYSSGDDEMVLVPFAHFFVKRRR